MSPLSHGPFPRPLMRCSSGPLTSSCSLRWPLTGVWRHERDAFYVTASLRDVTGLPKLSSLNTVDPASNPTSAGSFSNFRKLRTVNFIQTSYLKGDFGSATRVIQHMFCVKKTHGVGEGVYSFYVT
jgi:hypothetical protein